MLFRSVSQSRYTPSLTPVELIEEPNLSIPAQETKPKWREAEPLLPSLKSGTPPAQKSKGFPFLTILFIAVIGVFLLTMSQKKKSPSQDNLVAKLGSSEAAPFVRNIYDLIARNEMTRALEELSKYHQSNPRDLEYLIPYSALLIIENQNHDQARIYLDKVLTSSINNNLKAKAHLWYGYSLLAANEDDFGESHFLESLQLTPNDPATRFNLGRTYIKQQKYAHALDYLQLAEVEVPDLWLIHIYKGRAKVALNQRDEARASFRLAIESSPDRWLSYIYYSLFLSGSRDYNEAKLTLRNMLTRDPLFEIYSPAPWGFYQEPVNYREYLNNYTKVMERAREDELELGKVYISFLLNNYGPMENHRLQILAEKGGLLSRVLALSAQIKSETKTDDLRRAVVKLGGNLSEFGPYAYVIRAEAKTQLGIIQEAQQDLNSALLAEPKSAAARLLQYKLYRLQNKKEEAVRELQTILSYHPNYIPAINALKDF